MNAQSVNARMASLLLQLQGDLIWRVSEEVGLRQGQEVAARRARRSIANRLMHAFIEIVVLQSPEVVLEIGAHEASFSKEIKRRLSKTQVMAFEANPNVFKDHERDVSAAGVDYRRACITSFDGIQTFTVPINKGKGKMMTKMGSIFALQGADLEAERYEVDALKLDTLLANSPGASNMIWIDVEGAVGHVLQGATTSLQNCRGLYVELETTGHWEGQLVASQVVELLMSIGLYPVARDAQKRWQGNYLFLNEELLADGRVVDIVQEVFRSPPA